MFDDFFKELYANEGHMDVQLSSHDCAMDEFLQDAIDEWEEEGDFDNKLRFTIASVDSLESRGFVRVASNSDCLVRLSENDFWQLVKSDDGSLSIERLTDEFGNPISKSEA